MPARARRISCSITGSAARAQRPPRSGAPRILIGAVAALMLTAAPAALAHFQELIPSSEIVDAASERDLRLELRFTHPMAQGPVMPMGEPVRFGVRTPNGEQDLRDRLQGADIDRSRVYTADFRIDAPGDHIFFVEPAPYCDPAEGRLIVHCFWVRTRDMRPAD